MVAVDALGPEGPDSQRRDALVEAAFHRGLLLLGCGKAGVRFCPGLCVTAEQIEAALAIFAAAIQDASV
jgi:4-aminobutyrate aminotransferase